MDSNQMYNLIQIRQNNPKNTQGDLIVSNTHTLFQISEEGPLFVLIRKSIVCGFICFYVSTTHQPWQSPMPSYPHKCNHFPKPGTRHSQKVNSFSSQFSVKVSYLMTKYEEGVSKKLASILTGRQRASAVISDFQ